MRLRSLFTGLLSLLGGCTMSISTSFVATYGLFVPPLDTLAILPVSRVDDLDESFGRSVTDSLLMALRTVRRDVVVLAAETTITRLNAAGLGSTWAQAIRKYQESRVRDRSTIDSMSGAAHARFMLDVRAVGPALGRPGPYLVAQIWDGRSADVVWEGVAICQVEFTEWSPREPRTERVAAACARELAVHLRLHFSPRPGEH